MENLWSITLEAHNPERNHHRSYHISLGRDLFGYWTVEIAYGRCGQGKQSKRYGSTDLQEAKAVIQRALKRRKGAKGRIGCEYKESSISAKREASSRFDSIVEEFHCLNYGVEILQNRLIRRLEINGA